MTEERAYGNNAIIRWLEKYVDRRFDDHNAIHKVVAEFQRQQGEALETQRHELRRMDNYVREGQNEWRATMTDRERTFLTKAEHEGLVGRVDAMARVQTEHLSRFVAKDEYEGLEDKVDALSKSQSESIGRAQMQSLILAAFPTGVSVIALIYAFTQK